MLIFDLLRLYVAAGIVMVAAAAAALLDPMGSASEPLLRPTAGPNALVVGLALVSTVVIGAVLIGRRMSPDMRDDTVMGPPLDAVRFQRMDLATGLMLLGIAMLLAFLTVLGVRVWAAGIPFGILLGAEMQARCVGRPGGGRWILWMVGLLVPGVALVATGTATGIALDIFALVATLFGVALGVRWMAHRAVATARAQWDSLRRRDARRRAEWIHDHLLSEVSHTILAMRARPSVDHEAVARLQAMDHRLRMVQLDEVLSVGPTRVASILQPHLRWAQAHGLHIGSTPSSEDVSARVDPATGQMLSHVLSVLLSNAANAGAGSIGLDVTVHAHEVTVVLHDDAGGFDLAEIPVGRALEELQIDLGGDRIHREPRDGGSVVTVRVPRNLLIGRSGAVRRSGDRTVG